MRMVERLLVQRRGGCMAEDHDGLRTRLSVLWLHGCQGDARQSLLGTTLHFTAVYL